MTLKRLLLLAVVGALAVAAAGCGGGDDEGSSSAEGKAYSDAIVAAFAEDGESNPIPEEEARCAADRIVEILGVERLSDAGVTPEEIADSESVRDVVPDLSEEEASEIADTIFDCIDVGAVFAQGMAEAAAADGITLAGDKIECLGRNFAENQQLREAFVQSILGGPDPNFEDPNLIGAILGDCLTVEELLEIGLQVSTGASGE